MMNEAEPGSEFTTVLLQASREINEAEVELDRRVVDTLGRVFSINPQMAQDYLELVAVRKVPYFAAGLTDDEENQGMEALEKTCILNDKYMYFEGDDPEKQALSDFWCRLSAMDPNGYYTKQAVNPSKKSS